MCASTCLCEDSCCDVKCAFIVVKMSSAFTGSVKGVEMRDRIDCLCMHAYLYKTGLEGTFHST
jgi:hypothetical protein